MSIYYVPVVGFIVAVKEVLQAQGAYFLCHAKGGVCWAEYDATWGPFGNCGIAYISTMAGCLAAMAIASTVGWMKGRK